MYKIHLFEGPVVMLEEGLKQSRQEEEEEEDECWRREWKGSK